MPLHLRCVDLGVIPFVRCFCLSRCAISSVHSSKSRGKGLQAKINANRCDRCWLHGTDKLKHFNHHIEIQWPRLSSLKLAD
jgi:hypothetical protein